MACAFLLFLSMAIARSSQGFSVMSLDLGLTGQSGWQEWFNPTDSPEGTYLGTLLETQTNLTGIIPLGRTLQPGTHYVTFKIYDYKKDGILDFTIGGVSVQVTNLNALDFNGAWTVSEPITVTAASSNMQLTVWRTLPEGTRQLYSLFGLYITPSSEEVVYSDDSIMHVEYPTELATDPARKGNILQNGSFEVGGGHGWGLGEAGGRAFSMASLWDNGIGYEGEASLKVPNLSQLVSRPYRVRGNRQFTFSAWVKTAFNGTVTLTVESCVTKLPPGNPASVSFTESFGMSTNWQRVSISGVLLDYPTADYRLRIHVNDPQGGYTWVDAVQLEEGDLTDYVPVQPVEVGLVCSQPGNLFYEDEPRTMKLWVRNTGSTAASVTVPYEIYDYLNRQVVTGSTNVVVPANDRWSGDLDVSTGARGIFRAVLWAQGLDRTRDEIVYGVVPRPQQMGLDPSSVIGIHANLTDFQCVALQKLGVKWIRGASPILAFRWTVVEPTEGNFEWTSDDMTKASSNGISMIGTIGWFPSWAEDSQNPGHPDLEKWGTYVATLVDHYKSQVKYWEIWNEPHFTFETNFYGELLKEATLAIQGVDPEAKIIGLGGVAPTGWSIDTLDYLGPTWLTNNLAVLSTHQYPKNGAASYVGWRNISANYNLPVWNTEAGVWGRGAYTSENSDFIQADGYIWPVKASERFEFGQRGAPELLAYGFLNSVGHGLAKYFYYDARIHVGPAYQLSHPTIFEYDDSIRAKGIAYAVLAKLFDHSVGLGNISPNSESYMYLYDRGGTPLVAIWSNDRINRSVALSLEPSLYQVYDLMGNPIVLTNGEIPYNSKPVYIEGEGISVAALQAAVQSGVVTTRADTTPPNLSLAVFPTGPTEANPVKLRWLAGDDTSSPWAGDSDALQYSYLLEGHDTTWSPWSALTFVDYFDLPSGIYDFQVKARDAAGNESPVSHVTVQVDNGAPSSPPSLSVSLSNGQLEMSWPLDNLGWILQSKTNSPGEMSAGNWSNVPGSDATNRVMLPIHSANSGVLFRLISP